MSIINLIENGQLLSPFLKHLRKIQNVTQKELAEKLNITQAEVSRIEGRKRQKTSIEMIKRICIALEITFQEFETMFADYVETIRKKENKIKKEIGEKPKEFIKKTEFYTPIKFLFRKGTNEESMTFEPQDTKNIIIDYDKCKISVIKKNNTQIVLKME